MGNYLKKYKWLYMLFLGVAIIVLSIVMFVQSAFGNSLVFYLFGGLLILYVLMRFAPLFKTTREKWALIINAMEMIIDIIVGVVMIVSTIITEDKTKLYSYFPFLLGGVFYLRGLIYMLEIVFLNTKAEKIKFFFSLILITFGTFIVSRNNQFDINFMRYLLIFIFFICSVCCIIDGTISYNNYRNNYVKIEKNKKKEVKNNVIIEGDTVEQPQNYVS